jgi:hypothetical protein
LSDKSLCPLSQRQNTQKASPTSIKSIIHHFSLPGMGRLIGSTARFLLLKNFCSANYIFSQLRSFRQSDNQTTTNQSLMLTAQPEDTGHQAE